MRDSRLLSTFQDDPLIRARAPNSEPVNQGSAQALSLASDFCQAGLVLRVLITVEVCLAACLLFNVETLNEWLLRFSLYTSATTPASLVWTLVICTLQRNRLLELRKASLRLTVGAVIAGLLAGVVAALITSMTGISTPNHLPAILTAAVLLSIGMLHALCWRARALEPSHTQARLIELQSRIRPHFLFNSLNSAIALVRAEPGRAESLLEDLSELFRAALRSDGELVSLNEELTLAKHYLAIEEVRFGDRLRVDWNLDPSTVQTRLPRLLLQPLVENAIKHGVEPSPSGADIRISTRKRGARVVIKITNSVPAGQGHPGSGIALDNVRERLRLMHDLECDFRYGLIDGHYQTRIEVPA